MARKEIITFDDHMNDVEDPATFTLGEAIVRIINDAPDYHDGQLEATVSKVNKLAEIVGTLANYLEPQMSDEDFKSLVSYPLVLKEDTL